MTALGLKTEEPVTAEETLTQEGDARCDKYLNYLIEVLPQIEFNVDEISAMTQRQASQAFRKKKATV